jgi:1,4-dihydroxy-2-naphthoate octaprenyltransferase
MFIAWIKAARLRTLPLAMCGIFIGSLLALHFGTFHLYVMLLCLLTAFFLQVLSNFANDYGDFKKGTDNENRIGPARTLQEGLITEQQMKIALIITSLFAFISGSALIAVSLQHAGIKSMLFFLGLGIASILAAIFYTVGKKAYGYFGLGDIFVFTFFGPVAVLGAYYLHQSRIDLPVIFPAISLGALSTGVLHMNNMRDIINDKVSGKITIAVRLGIVKGKIYHFVLMLIACLSAVWFQLNYLEFHIYGLIPLLVLVPHIYMVLKTNEHQAFDGQLKIVVLISVLYTISLGLVIFKMKGWV